MKIILRSPKMFWMAWTILFILLFIALTILHKENGATCAGIGLLCSSIWTWMSHQEDDYLSTDFEQSR